MPKPEWGVKRVCPTTGKRFYDLNKSPVVSPYSGEVVDLEQAGTKVATPARASRAASTTAKAKPAEPAEADPLLEEDETEPAAGSDLLEEDADESVSFDDLTDVADDGTEN